LEIAKKYGTGIDLSIDNFEGCEKQVKNNFVQKLAYHEITTEERMDDGAGINLSQIQADKFKTGQEIMEFFSTFDFTKEIKDAYLDNLLHGDNSMVKDIEEKLGEGVDFKSIDAKDEEKIKKQFIKTLAEGSYIAVCIKNKFDGIIDFHKIKGYKKAVEKRFLKGLSDGSAAGSEETEKLFGEGIDLRNIPEYEKAVKEGFKKALIENASVRLAKVIKEKFGAGFDFSFEINQGLKILLSRRDFTEVKLIKENFLPDLDIFKFAKENNCFTFDLLLYLGNKNDWKNEFGEEEFTRFLEALPKNSAEKRNAFTHNNYDRTSKFFYFLNRNSFFDIKKEDFEIATEYIEKFGLATENIVYEYFKNLKLLEKGLIKELPGEQIEDGIISIEILENKYNTLKNIVFSEKPMLGKELENLSDFELGLLSNITGKSSHRFNAKHLSLKSIIGYFKEYSSGKDYVDVPAEYHSFDVEVKDVEISFDKEKIKKDYTVLKEEILSALNGEIKDADKLIVLKNQIIEKLTAKITELEKSNENKQITFIIDQISEYRHIKEMVEKSDNFDSLIVSLLDIDKKTAEKFDFYSPMRQIIFRKILEKNYSSGQAIENIHNNLTDEVTGKGVLSIIDVVNNFAKDHVLNMKDKNKEKYWTESAWNKIKEAKDMSKMVNLLKIFSPYLDNLKNEADNFQAIDKNDNFKISCIPDRGFIGEMSGFLADVCYTEEKRLLQRFPNVIPFKFVVDDAFGNKNFIGSVLVFEVTDNKGDKVDLLRGFDVPQEDGFNIFKFIESFMDQLQSMAKKRGVKKIIIPGFVGAISNYSLTVNHMNKNYIKSENQVSLSERFSFNNYDITNDCYVAREN